MPEKLKFFDVASKKFFETDKYEITEKLTKTGRVIRIAYAVSPYTGKKTARILGPVKK